MVHPIYKNRCFSPKFSVSISGMKMRKPNSIIINPMAAPSLIFIIFSYFRQSIRANRGDNIIRGKGIPTNPCNLRGIGKIAGPARNEKNKSTTTGITEIFLDLLTLYRPITNKTLRIEQSTSPIVKRYCGLEFRAPSSLTKFDK